MLIHQALQQRLWIRLADPNSTGSYNNAFGYTAMQQNTTGDNNTAFGHAALRYNSTGDYNIAIGFEALYNHTTDDILHRNFALWAIPWNKKFWNRLQSPMEE